jgi:hypothetical protein
MVSLVMLCFCYVIFTRHLFIADLSSFCTYAILAGPSGDRFCNPHVVIFLLSKHHHHHHHINIPTRSFPRHNLVATYARGYPVALEARADERDNLAFTWN